MQLIFAAIKVRNGLRVRKMAVREKDPAFGFDKTPAFGNQGHMVVSMQRIQTVNDGKRSITKRKRIVRRMEDYIQIWAPLC